MVSSNILKTSKWTFEISDTKTNLSFKQFLHQNAIKYVYYQIFQSVLLVVFLTIRWIYTRQETSLAFTICLLNLAITVVTLLTARNANWTIDYFAVLLYLFPTVAFTYLNFAYYDDSDLGESASLSVCMFFSILVVFMHYFLVQNSNFVMSQYVVIPVNLVLMLLNTATMCYEMMGFCMFITLSMSAHFWITNY